MDLTDWLAATPEPRKREIASQAGTKLVYLEQIAAGKRKPSPKLCKGLLTAEPSLSLRSLRSDIAELCEMVNGKRRRA